VTTNSALQKNIKGDSLNRKERPKVTKTRKAKRISRNNDKTSNKMALNTYLPIITECKWTKHHNQKIWNVRMDKNTRPVYILCTRLVLDLKIESEGMEKYLPCNSTSKERVVVLIFNRLDFNPKTVTRNEERYYIIIKGSIQQEDLTFVNIYAPKWEDPDI